MKIFYQMTEGNNNLMLEYRYLSGKDFKDCCEIFIVAYSDYFVPLKMTGQQFDNHLAQTSVDLEKSVGAFVDGKMIGLTLNGFGEWNGEPTVYDSGTGIIADFRNRGAGRGMFEFMMPDLKKDGHRQILLEVITENLKAIRLYRGLGFETTRTLIYFVRESVFGAAAKTEFEIREISSPDWKLLKTFGAGKPAWQNSVAAFERNGTKKIIIGAFEREKCVGYGTAYCNSGLVNQIAVAETHRRRGAATQILAELQKCVGEHKNLRVSNVDENLNDVIGFLENRGFGEHLRQFEMMKIL